MGSEDGLQAQRSVLPSPADPLSEGGWFDFRSMLRLKLGTQVNSSELSRTQNNAWKEVNAEELGRVSSYWSCQFASLSA